LKCAIVLTRQHVITSSVLEFVVSSLTWHFAGYRVRKLVSSAKGAKHQLSDHQLLKNISTSCSQHNDSDITKGADQDTGTRLSQYGIQSNLRQRTMFNKMAVYVVLYTYQRTRKTSAHFPRSFKLNKNKLRTAQPEGREGGREGEREREKARTVKI
jgi:hypothetical protein